MIFWAIAIVLLVIVAVSVIWPLARGKADARDEVDFDIEVFRDQLAEVGRERADGRLGNAEAEAAKVEISRRILAADSGRKKARGIFQRQVLRHDAVARRQRGRCLEGDLRLFPGCALPHPALEGVHPLEQAKPFVCPVHRFELGDAIHERSL